MLLCLFFNILKLCMIRKSTNPEITRIQNDKITGGCRENWTWASKKRHSPKNFIWLNYKFCKILVVEKNYLGDCWTTRSMRLPQNYVYFHWSMFWELTIAFSNPSCPTLKFWFWLTSNFLKTRFFQKAHFKGPWKARSKGLANDESKNLLLISPGFLSEKVEVEEKSAQPQLFDQGHLQFYRNLFFLKKLILCIFGER